MEDRELPKGLERLNYPFEIVDSNLNPLDNLKIQTAINLSYGLIRRYLPEELHTHQPTCFIIDNENKFNLSMGLPHDGIYLGEYEEKQIIALKPEIFETKESIFKSSPFSSHSVLGTLTTLHELIHQAHAERVGVSHVLGISLTDDEVKQCTNIQQYKELLKRKYKDDVEKQTPENNSFNVLVGEALANGADTYVTHRLLSEDPLTKNEKLLNQLKFKRSQPFHLGHWLKQNEHLIAFIKTFRPLQKTLGVDKALKFLLNVDLDKCNGLTNEQYNFYLNHPENLPQLPPASLQDDK